MQPFIPARLKQALTVLRLRVPGGPADRPAFRTLMARPAADLPGADAPGRPTGGPT